MALAMLLHSLLFTIMATTFADILLNPDFESPPTNITTNTTTTTTSFLLLTKATNTIPGWSFNGTIWYVTSGPNISLPGNGHALQLGPHGIINQTFKNTQQSYNYVLIFTLAPGRPDCANNLTAVNVSALGSSKVFFFKGHYGKQKWETTHAYSLGNSDCINLKIQSVSNGT